MLFVISGFPSLFSYRSIDDFLLQNHVQLEVLASLSKPLYYLVLDEYGIIQTVYIKTKLNIVI